MVLQLKDSVRYVAVGYVYVLASPAIKVIIAIEAGLENGWSKIIGLNGHFIGMNSFGASAPGETLYKYFGITSQAIIDLAKNQLKQP